MRLAAPRGRAPSENTGGIVVLRPWDTRGCRYYLQTRRTELVYRAPLMRGMRHQEDALDTGGTQQPRELRAFWKVS